MMLTESQLALAALASLCAGERESGELLRTLLRRVRPHWFVPWASRGPSSLKDARRRLLRQT